MKSIKLLLCALLLAIMGSFFAYHKIFFAGILLLASAVLTMILSLYQVRKEVKEADKEITPQGKQWLEDDTKNFENYLNKIKRIIPMIVLLVLFSSCSSKSGKLRSVTTENYRIMRHDTVILIHISPTLFDSAVYRAGYEQIPLYRKKITKTVERL
jgi:hypothetical protein